MFFWNNPDNFWDSLVIMIRNIHELVPTSSCEVLLKIVKMMNIYIPVIELNQTMSFPNEIKEKITTLCQDVQNTIDHMETEQVVTDSTRDPDAVPNDFRLVFYLIFRYYSGRVWKSVRWCDKSEDAGT